MLIGLIILDFKNNAGCLEQATLEYCNVTVSVEWTNYGRLQNNPDDQELVTLQY